MKLKTNIKKGNFTGWFFVLPALIIVVLLLFYPVTSSIVYSFTSKNLIRSSYKFVGFDNYISILTNSEFYKAFFTSIKWTVASLFFQLLIGFTAALALNKIPKLSGIYRTLLIIPWAFPSIVIAISWKWILSDIYGFLPNLLNQLNVTDGFISFLTSPNLVFWTVLFINVWFGFPLIMVNILSALQTIPKEQYEAAKIDGANSFQSFRHITFRHIRVVIGLLLVLRTIWIFNNFELIYLLTGGGPSDFTTTLPIFAYKTGWGLKQIGVASAITIILLGFLLSICFIYFRMLDKWEKEDEVI